MTRTRIATAVAALAVAGASITVIVPATFANGNGDKPASTPTPAPAQCVPGTCPGDPLPGTQDPESFDIGTPPTVDGDVDLGGAQAPTAP
ncbi:MAG: hypothetical protein ACJ72D_02390 [Marmoricola sp.]